MSILARPNIVTVLLEYINLFNLSSNIKQLSIWKGDPAIYHTILLYFIVSLAIVATLFASIIPAFYSVLSNFFADKIDTSL